MCHQHEQWCRVDGWCLTFLMQWQPTVLSASLTTFSCLAAAMQNLQKYVTAANQLWSKVQGRTHGHEHMLRFLAIKLWNQLGVLQEVITL